MKVFTTREIGAARAHAVAGGQALHVMAGAWLSGRARPSCFRINREFAHLFDCDHERLRETAKQLGVKDIMIDASSDRVAHVDLCGLPLRKALRIALESDHESE